MTQTGTGRTESPQRDAGGRRAYSWGAPGTGWLWFAAVMLFLAGCQNLIYGIAVLGDYIVVVNNLTTGGVDHIIYADMTFWGWLWISVGIVEVVAAIALPSRNQLVRWFAIALATVNAVGQLAFLAAFPVWSIAIIAIDILIIYGLLTWDVPARPAYGPYPDDMARAAERPADQPAADQPAAHQPAADQTAADQTATDQTAAHRPAADRAWEGGYRSTSGRPSAAAEARASRSGTGTPGGSGSPTGSHGEPGHNPTRP